MSRRTKLQKMRRYSGPRRCPRCGKSFRTNPRFEKHLHAARVADETGQTCETEEANVDRLIEQGILKATPGGNLEMDEALVKERYGLPRPEAPSDDA